MEVQPETTRRERRYIRVPIFVDPIDPRFCHQPSARHQVNPDGCEAFHYDDSGDAFCGAFDAVLAPVDDDVNDEYAQRFRCEACLKSEVP